jgi:uncharacterized protein
MDSGLDLVIRDDFTYVLRGKLQSLSSRFYNAFGWRRFDQELFQINHVEANIKRLPEAFRNYRIIHISDIHYGQWISAKRLAGVVALINQNKPDLVAITGDFVSYLLNEEVEEMPKYLKMLKAKDLVVAVLGNHDHWAGAERVREILKKSGIQDVSNDFISVLRGDSVLYVAGVDSAIVGQAQLDVVLDKLPLDGPAILLAHEPDFAIKSAKTHRFILQLSGHSHGGQFIIPGFGTPFKDRFSKKYPVGKYHVGEMVLYTNRGLGTNSYWFRINCSPEITVISLL